jgi:hypothetical protein
MLLFLWRKKWGQKMAWSQTHAYNSKINSFPGVVSPKGMSFLFAIFISDVPF